MLFQNFSYNCGAGLSWLSMVVTNALAHIPQAAGISAANPHKPHLMWIPHADMLEWDMHSEGISYGRYLTYTKSPGNDYPFWVGLYISRTELQFCMWFDISLPNISPKVAALQAKFPPPIHVVPSAPQGVNRSLYIWLDAANNTALLDGSGSQTQCEQIVQNFADSVLQCI
jgi:hypothetical protein